LRNSDDVAGNIRFACRISVLVEAIHGILILNNVIFEGFLNP